MGQKAMNSKKVLAAILILIAVAASIGVALKLTVLRADDNANKDSVAADSLLKNPDIGIGARDSLLDIASADLDGKSDSATDKRVHPSTADKTNMSGETSSSTDSAKKPDGKTPGHGWSVSDSDSLFHPFEHQSGQQAEEPGSGYFIRISKGNRQLTLFKDGIAEKIYPVGVGQNSGDKTRKSDNATPEGNFRIESINNSKDWKFSGARAYGPWFLRVDTSSGAFSGKSWTGIGIHGTSNENSIGGFVSHGCIRMYNKDITELKETIEEQFNESGVNVVILP
jgi:hypothetical protein